MLNVALNNAFNKKETLKSNNFKNLVKQITI